MVGARVGEKEGFLYPRTVGDRVFVGANDLQQKYRYLMHYVNV